MARYLKTPLFGLLFAGLLAFASLAGAAVDDSYTKSLLHLNGPNGYTTFTDESPQAS